MRRTGPELSALLDAASKVMTELAIHPLYLKIDAKGTRILTVMRRSALLTRSRGPYSRDNLPPEAVKMIEWAALQFSVKPEQPKFAIQGGGQWPSLTMTLPASHVQVRYVVPEAAPPVYEPDPGNITLSSDIRLMLRLVADSLRAAGGVLGKEPPVALTLSYLDDPKYGEWLESAGDEFGETIPPVVATLEVDRSRCSKKQRAAHDDALPRVGYKNQPWEPLGKRGFTTRIGWARLQDSDA
ncbi:MAG: hypothetical protein ACRDPK_13870 [Carbonactinosporaceae bacterium]